MSAGGCHIREKMRCFWLENGSICRLLPQIYELWVRATTRQESAQDPKGVGLASTGPQRATMTII
jgi:hypothetical protein